jgi:hypothetical protein
MGKIVRFESGGIPVLIETSEVEYKDGSVEVRGHPEKDFDKMLESIQPFCASIIKNFESLVKKPDSASAEFGLNITGEGNLIIVKATEATIKITLNWDLIS